MAVNQIDLEKCWELINQATDDKGNNFVLPGDEILIYKEGS